MRHGRPFVFAQYAPRRAPVLGAPFTALPESHIGASALCCASISTSSVHSFAMASWFHEAISLAFTR